MDANSFVIRRDGLTDYNVNIPIQMDWSMMGQDMSIDLYEEDVINKVVGKPYDFEVDRFSHLPFSGKSEINYEFYFYSGGSMDDQTNWTINYMSEGFTTQDIFYYSNSFSNSFFKLDFYDSVEDKKQVNYVTIILPTQQGLLMPAVMQRTNVNIKKPKFILDYIGDIEGFFFYWLKSRDFLDVSTFYMSAKFYNAKTGGFTKMMNRPQSDIIGDKYYFEGTNYFYYRLDLDYTNQTYQVFNTKDNVRVGTTTPIKWYEYVNPPA